MEISKLEGVTVSLFTNFKGANSLRFAFKGKEENIVLANADYDACLVALYNLGARHIDE